MIEVFFPQSGRALSATSNGLSFVCCAASAT